jgi:hypothetical protein
LPDWGSAYCLQDAHTSRAGQEKLQILLADLDKPINRMATQLSDIHDYLEGFAFPVISQLKKAF